jgi:hypothetical protein
MNKTEKWIIGLLVMLIAGAFGFVIHQGEVMETKITHVLDQVIDLRVAVATLGTKLDDHIRERALADPPALTNSLSELKQISTQQTDP